MRTKKLAWKIRNREVSEKDCVHHLIAFSILSVIASCRFMDSPAPYHFYDMISDAFIFLSAAGYPLLAYYINNKGDNQDVIKRFIMIAVPITIQSIFIFMIPIAVAFIIDNIEIILSAAEDEEFPITVMGPWSTASIGGSMLYMAWRYIVAFSIASGLKGAPNV